MGVRDDCDGRGLMEVTLRINEIEISMEITVGICGFKRGGRQVKRKSGTRHF